MWAPATPSPTPRTPVYTGKAWAKFLMLVKEGYFDGQEHIAFVHTGGAAALFAMDLG